MLKWGGVLDNRLVHVGDQKSLHNPVGIPVVEFAESSTGDDEWVRHVYHGIQFRTIPDIV